MRFRHPWAVAALCALPLLLTGCTVPVDAAGTDVARALPSPAPLSSPENPGTMPKANPVHVMVRGVVLSTAGRPFGGAMISVRPLPNTRDCLSCGAAVTRTDAGGRFTLDLARGDYALRCAAPDGRVCRLEDAAAPGLFTASSTPRELTLTMTRAGTPHPR